MRSKRTGVTLIELLVAITIIAILVGLLTPALQAARETARLTQCQNHLKQMGLAFQSYQGAFRIFPGYGGEREPARVHYPADRTVDASMMTGSWIVQAMMFMEKQDLAEPLSKLANDTNVSPSSEVTALLTQPVEQFSCPSRRDSEPIPLVREYQSRFGDVAVRTDYAMNGGPAEVMSNVHHIESIRDGVWRLGLQTVARKIVDGLSNTYMVGEKAMDTRRYDTGNGFGDLSPLMGWADRYGSTNSYVRYAARTPKKDTVRNCLVCHDFGSAHPAGWNALMADGSVKMFTYTMDLEVHRQTASINDRD